MDYVIKTGISPKAMQGLTPEYVDKIAGLLEGAFHKKLEEDEVSKKVKREGVVVEVHLKDYKPTKK